MSIQVSDPFITVLALWNCISFYNSGWKSPSSVWFVDIHPFCEMPFKKSFWQFLAMTRSYNYLTGQMVCVISCLFWDQIQKDKKKKWQMLRFCTYISSTRFLVLLMLNLWLICVNIWKLYKDPTIFLLQVCSQFSRCIVWKPVFPPQVVLTDYWKSFYCTWLASICNLLFCAQGWVG